MIPRILHRTVPAETTVEVEIWWAKACELHPAWRHHTWRDPLDREYWPLTSDAWDRCTSGAQKAGLIRLEALYVLGGFYIDSDVELYRPLDPLRGARIVAGWEDADVIPDAVLAAEPRHPLVRAMIDRAVVIVEGGYGAWGSGPGVTTSMLRDADPRHGVLLLPPGSFYPYHYTEKHERRHEPHRAQQPWAFGAHHWHHSWA